MPIDLIGACGYWPKIPCKNPCYREFRPETGSLWTAATATESGTGELRLHLVARHQLEAPLGSARALAVVAALGDLRGRALLEQVEGELALVAASLDGFGRDRLIVPGLDLEDGLRGLHQAVAADELDHGGRLDALHARLAALERGRLQRCGRPRLRDPGTARMHMVHGRAGRLELVARQCHGDLAQGFELAIRDEGDHPQDEDREHHDETDDGMQGGSHDAFPSEVRPCYIPRDYPLRPGFFPGILNMP